MFLTHHVTAAADTGLQSQGPVEILSTPFTVWPRRLIPAADAAPSAARAAVQLRIKLARLRPATAVTP